MLVTIWGAGVHVIETFLFLRCICRCCGKPLELAEGLRLILHPETGHLKHLLRYMFVKVLVPSAKFKSTTEESEPPGLGGPVGV